MRESKIDEVCHNVLNYLPVIKGMVIDIEQSLRHIIDNGDSKRETALSVALSYLGTPYLWGGDDPVGFDCSGYIIEALKSVGLLPRKGDWTADVLYHRFIDLEIGFPVRGALVFWFTEKGKARHVEICLNGALAIGASGGGPLIQTLNDAMKANAFVKVRPIDSRSGMRRYIDPF